MGIGLGLELGSGVRVAVMARALVGIRIRILFCSSIAQFYALCIAQMRNGYGIKTRVRVSS